MKGLRRMMFFGSRMLQRGLSLFLSFSFFLTHIDVLYAQGPHSQSSLDLVQEFRLAQDFSIKNIVIPQSLGLLKKTYDGTNHKLVIHIQDLHAHSGAQHKISQTVQHLMRQYWIRLVGVEGAEGAMDVGAYRDLLHRKASKRTAEYLLQQGLLTGSEFLAITSKEPFRLVGVENQVLHTKNLEQFRKAIHAGAPVLKMLENLSLTLKELKIKHYSPELLKFDEVLENYHTQGIKLAVYFETLQQYAKALSIGMGEKKGMIAFLRAQEIEARMDLDRVGKEQDLLLQRLNQRLSHTQLEELVKKALWMRMGKISLMEYYEYFRGLLQKLDGDKALEKTPHFGLYLEYLQNLSQGEAQGIFTEAEELEGRIKEKLFKTDTERDLEQLSKNLSILKKFLSLTLSSQELEYFQAHVSELQPDVLMRLLSNAFFRHSGASPRLVRLWRRSRNPEGPQNEYLDYLVKPGNDEGKNLWHKAMTLAKDFYQTARTRDHVLVTNLLRQMEEEKVQTAILVTGGFHTEGMIQDFQEKGISYGVVTPNITSFSHESQYLSLMMQKELPFQKFIEKLYRLGAETSKISRALFTADPKNYGLYRFLYAVFQPGEVNVLEFPGFSIQKTEVPVGDGKVRVEFNLVKDLVPILLGTVEVRHSDGLRKEKSGLPIWTHPSLLSTEVMSELSGVLAEIHRKPGLTSSAKDSPAQSPVTRSAPESIGNMQLVGQWFSFFQEVFQHLGKTQVIEIRGKSYLLGTLEQKGTKIPFVMGRAEPGDGLPDIFLVGDQVEAWLGLSQAGASVLGGFDPAVVTQLAKIWKGIFDEKFLRSLESSVLYSVDRGVATITLNRPNKLNVLNLEMVRMIKANLAIAREDPSVKAVLFKGNAKAFSAGGDMVEVLQHVQTGQDEEAVDFFREEYEMDLLIHEFPKPTISIVEGMAYGGGLGIARNSQVLIAGSNATFSMPESKIGFFPDVGASDFLSRYLGRAWAKYYGMTGVVFSAQEAQMGGLVDTLVDAKDVAHLEDILKEAIHKTIDKPLSAQDIQTWLEQYYRPREGSREYRAKHDLIRKFFDKDTVYEIVKALAEATGILGGGDPKQVVELLMELSESNLLKKQGDLSKPVFFAQEVLWHLVRRSPATIYAWNALVDRYDMHRSRAKASEEDLALAEEFLSHPDLKVGIADVLIDKKRDAEHRPNWQGNLLQPGEVIELPNMKEGQGAGGTGQGDYRSGDYVVRRESPPLIRPWFPEYLATATDPEGAEVKIGLEDLRSAVEEIRKFLRGEVRLHYRRLDSDLAFAKEMIPKLFKKAGELGLYGLLIPEEFGGLGWDELAGTLMAIELGRSGASFATTVKAHTGIGTFPILLHGSDALKKKYLPDLASGEKMAAFALTEPDSGSDALSKQSSIGTTAKLERNPETGEGEWVLNGSKQWITNAGFADVFVVFAKTGVNDKGEAILSAFVVDRRTSEGQDTPGFSLGTEWHSKMGVRGSSTYTIHFDNVRIPKANLIGKVGDGAKIGMETLNYGRLALGEAVLGGGIEAINNAVEFLNGRKQFGKPIGQFGMTREMLAQMVINVYALGENVVYPVSAEVSSGLHVFPTEAAVVKYAASEMFWDNALRNVRLHGGIGFMMDEDANLGLRDALINVVWEGSNQIQLLLAAEGSAKAIARKWMSLPVPKRLTRIVGNFFGILSRQLIFKIFGGGFALFIKPTRLLDFLKGDVELKDETGVLKTAAAIHLPGFSIFLGFSKGPLEKEDYLVDLAEYLIDWTARGLGQLGKKLREDQNQTFLADFAKMVVDFYAMKNTLERTQYRLKEGFESEREVLISQVFIHDAYKRIVDTAQQLHRDLGFKMDVLNLLGIKIPRLFPVLFSPGLLKERAQKIQRIAELTLESGGYERPLTRRETLHTTGGQAEDRGQRTGDERRATNDERRNEGTAIQMNGEPLTAGQDAVVDEAIRTYFDLSVAESHGFLNSKRVEDFRLSSDDPAFEVLDPNNRLREIKAEIFVFEGLMERINAIAKKRGVDPPDLLTHPSTNPKYGKKLYLDSRVFEILKGLPDSLRDQWSAHEALHLRQPTWQEVTVERTHSTRELRDYLKSLPPTEPVEPAGRDEDPYLIQGAGDWDRITAEYRADPDKFWLRRAYEELEWFKRPTQGITESVDAEGHFNFTYFEDGVLNASYEILDRQVKRGMGDMPAYTWISDPADDQGNAEETKTVTYSELLALVEKFANALTEMGVGKGDGVTLYTASNTIEAKVARFACMRIGAIFTPVFPGLSAQELSDRAHQINTKVVLTVNASFRKGQMSLEKEEVVDKAFEEYIPREMAEGFIKNALAEAGVGGEQAREAYAATASEIKGYITIHYTDLAKILNRTLEGMEISEGVRNAVKASIQQQTRDMPSRINNIVVIERVYRDRAIVPMKEGRDVYFNDVMKKMEDQGKTKFEPVPLPAEHPLFVIFTSGSTGKPKGAYHTTGGYLTNISYSMKFAWGVKPGERIFVAADDGWITGNSAMSDAPLMNGMHSFLYEGLPNWPTPDRIWKILSENKINYYKTGVTPVRDFSKGDANLITKWDLSSLKASCSCAEPLYAYVQAFWEEVILGGRPERFANFFWRTEDGMFSPFIPHPLGKPQKPDASTVGSPWAEVRVLVLENDEGGNITGFRDARLGEMGSAFIRHHPSMIRGLWNDPDRFRDTYWPTAVVVDGKRWHKVGDAARMDEDGYVTFLGRDDEVINVSGHRIGTQELESLVGRVDEVRLASVVGMPHLIKGETPIAFVILKTGVQPTPELDTKIRKAVEEGKGKIARPEEIIYVTDLPQTMSKKILRRFLEVIAAMPRAQLYDIHKKLQDPEVRDKVLNKDKEILISLFGEKVGGSAQTLPIGATGTSALIAVIEGIVEKREIGETAERQGVQMGDPYEVDFEMVMPMEVKDFIRTQFERQGLRGDDGVRAKRNYELIRRLTREAERNGADPEGYIKQRFVDMALHEIDPLSASIDFEKVSNIRQAAIQDLMDQGLLWPLGKPYVPGEKLPKYMFAWAIVKDRFGRPVYGEPEDAQYEMIAPTPKPGPNELVGYTLFAGITRNMVAAGEDANVGGFNFHQQDYHISGSDGVFLTAQVGSEVEKAGITRVGDLFNNYSGEAGLLDYRMGYNPMATPDFRIKGYQTPDGTLAQFARFQGPQLMRKPDPLTLEEASSYNLDLGTVYKALVHRAGVDRGDYVYVEGAAGGTGHLAVEVGAMQGAFVTGLVSSHDRGEFAKQHGASAYILRTDPRFDALWQPVPDPEKESEKYQKWVQAAEAFEAEFKKNNDGHLADVVNASVGRPTFAANVELLAHGGKLVYYGADKGFSLTFRGKHGRRTAKDAFKKNKLQPGEGVLIYYGASLDEHGEDSVALEAIEEAVIRKARVVVIANTVEEQINLQKKYRDQLTGIESIETLLKSNASFEWPEEMPDLDTKDESGKITTDADKRYYYQEHTLKIMGSVVGRFLRTPDNPNGFPDVVVERAGQNTLGISAWMARPITGRVVYLEDSANRRFRFYAPDVWMNQKTIDFPNFSILGTHLFDSFQANVVGRKLETGQLKMARPKSYSWEAAPAAVQELFDGKVIGTNAVRVGAPPVEGMQTEQEVYKQWNVVSKTFGTVKVRVFEVSPGGRTLAQVTMEGPNLNALNTAMVDSLAQAVDWISSQSSVQAVVLTGGGYKSFIAGADIKELQQIIDREEGRELAEKAQGIFATLESMNVPVVAAINGFALGGGTELAMSAHYRVASVKAEMGQPEINLGLIPGFGGTQRLTRLLSRKHGQRGLIEAAKMILNGRRISAHKAHRLGLVDELAESDALSRAMELALEYVKKGEGVLAEAMAERHREILDWNEVGTLEEGTIEKDPEIKTIIAQSREMGRANAVTKALKAIYTGIREGISKGLAVEAEAFGDLIVGPNDGRRFIEAFLKKESPPLPVHDFVEETPDPTIIGVSRLAEEAAQRLGYRAEAPVSILEALRRGIDAAGSETAMKIYEETVRHALEEVLKPFHARLLVYEGAGFDEGFYRDKVTNELQYQLSQSTLRLLAESVRDEKMTEEGRRLLDIYLEHVQFWARGADIAGHEAIMALFDEANRRDRERGARPRTEVMAERRNVETDEGKTIPLGPIDPHQWKGKVVIITGGGTGLGKEMVMNFARAGAHVVINGRRLEKLKETAREVKNTTGMDITSVEGDVVAPQDLMRLFGEAKERFGHIDIVINNAGVSGDVKFLPMISVKNFIYDAMIHLHIWNTTRHFKNLMEGEDRPGTIINVGTYFTTPSRYEKRPYLFRIPYTIAQGMKLVLTKLFAREMKKQDIVVAAVNPGPFEGERISTIVYPKGSRIRDILGTPQVAEDIRKGTEGLHARRFVTIEEVARNVMLMTAQEHRQSFHGEIIPMGGIDYQVPPTVMPILELGTQPDLKNRTVVLTAPKEAKEKLISIVKGLATAGAHVTIATEAAESLASEFSAYGGRVTLQEINMEDEGSVSKFFSGVGSMDAVFHVTGEPNTQLEYATLDPSELEIMVRRYAFLPMILISKYASAGMIYQSLKKQGVDDPRVNDFGSFMKFMERELDKNTFSKSEVRTMTSVIEKHANPEHKSHLLELVHRYVSSEVYEPWTDEERNFTVEHLKQILNYTQSSVELEVSRLIENSPEWNLINRLIEGMSRVWTQEEKKIFQAGLKKSKGQITVIGPELPKSKDPLPKYRAEVFREALGAAMTTFGAELGAAKTGIRANLILPGSLAKGPGDPHKLTRMVMYMASTRGETVNGAILEPDERNSAAGWLPSLEGKKVIVTGGARNMGKAIAQKMAAAGAHVLIAARGRGDGALKATEEGIRASGGFATSIEADVTSPSQIKTMVDWAMQTFKKVDGLVNNAGVAGVFARTDEIPMNDVDPSKQQFGWHSTMKINFHGPLEVMARVIPLMRKYGGGSIQQIVTEYAKLPYIYRSIYVGSKAAFGALSLAIAGRLSKEGIHITNINPSLIAGERMDLVLRNNINRLIKDEALKPEYIDLMSRQVDEWRERDSRVKQIVETLEAKSEMDIPRDVLKPIAWFWAMISLPTEVILSKEFEWGEKLTDITLYFKLILPLNPPTNADVGIESVHVAANPEMTAKKDRYVSDLESQPEPPIHQIPEVHVNLDKSFEGKTALIAASAFDDQVIERWNSLIEAYFVAGAKRVVLAVPRSWYDAGDPVKAQSPPSALQMLIKKYQKQLQVYSVDFEREDEINPIFYAGPFDAAVYLVSNPSQEDRFTDFYFDKNLSVLTPDEFEAQLKDHRERRERFERLHLTAPMLVFREATKYMDPSRQMVFLTPSQPSAEGLAATRMIAELVQVRNAERKILNQGLRASVWDAGSQPIGEAAKFIVGLTSTRKGSLDGKVALITGGGKNMGKAIAIQLALEGAKVVISGRDRDALQSAVDELRALGADAEYIVSDVAHETDVEHQIQETLKQFGKIDILVNNAGIAGRFALIEEIPLETPDDGNKTSWNTTMAIDFVGAWFAMLKGIRAMRKLGIKGSVVNISTFYADQPYIFRGIYTIPKILLKALTKILAGPLGRYGISIMDVRPSLIKGERMDLVIKGNLLKLKALGVLSPELIAWMEQSVDQATVKDVVLKKTMEELAARPKDIPPELVKAITWFWMMLALDKKEILERQEIPRALRNVLLNFKKMIPTDPPSNADVARKVLFLAQNGSNQSGQEHFVSSLPPDLDYLENQMVQKVGVVNVTPKFNGGAVFISTLSTQPEDLRRIEKMIQSYREAGIGEVIFALPKAVDGRVVEKLKLKAEALGLGYFFVKTDFLDEAEIVNLFKWPRHVQAAVHITGIPETDARFLDLPLLPTLGTLDDADFRVQELENQMRMKLFVDRYMTGSLLFAREASKKLAEGGSFVFVGPQGELPESVLLREGLSQIVREKETEREVLGSTSRDLHAYLVNPTGSSAKDLAAWVSFLSSEKARTRNQIDKWIDDLDYGESDGRKIAVRSLYEMATEDARRVMGEKWGSDPELMEVLGWPGARGQREFTFDAVGVAVGDERFNDIYDAWGNPKLADVPLARQTKEFTIDVGEARLDILGSTALGSAIDKFLEKNGEGIQQVEVFVKDVEQVTKILRQRAAAGQGPYPIYTSPERGAEGRLINFILLDHPKGGKLLIELVQGLPKTRPQGAQHLVAVIGAGPAGLGAAEALAKAGHRVVIFNSDVKEGGLSRYGIYVNKLRMKNSYEEIFGEVLQNPNIHYMGNVTVGSHGDITFDELQRIGFSAIAIAGGAQGSKKLGIPLEDQYSQIYDAKDIVYYYNGSPKFKDLNPQLGATTAFVGIGNVTVDVTNWAIHKKDYTAVQKFVETLGAEEFLTLRRRLGEHKELQELLSQISKRRNPIGRPIRMDELRSALEIVGLQKFLPRLESAWEATDVEETKNIYWLARRGPAEKAFEPRELEDLAPYVNLDDLRQELRRIQPVMKWEDAQLETILLELLFKHPKTGKMPPQAKMDNVMKEFGTKLDKARIHMRFLVSPKGLQSDGQDRLTAVILQKNTLVGTRERMKSVATGDEMDIPVDSMIRSIGNVADSDLGLPMQGDLYAVREVQEDRETKRPHYEMVDPITGKVIPGVIPLGWARKPSEGVVGLAKKDGVEAVKLSAGPFVEELWNGAMEFERSKVSFREAEEEVREGLLSYILEQGTLTLSSTDAQKRVLDLQIRLGSKGTRIVTFEDVLSLRKAEDELGEVFNDKGRILELLDEARQARGSDTPPVQLLITRAARKKFGLAGSLYSLVNGPGDEKQIQYNSKEVGQLIRQAGFYRHEIVWLGVLHEARHDAIAQIQKEYDLIEGLRDELLEAFSSEGSLKNFLKAFYLAFPEPELYEEILVSGISEDELYRLEQFYTVGGLSPESEASQQVQRALNKLLDGERGLDLAVEELLIRYIESQNEELRNHPFLQSHFYENQFFKVTVKKAIKRYFLKTAKRNVTLTKGKFRDEPIHFSLLQFSNGAPFQITSILHQLRNAHKRGFNLRGVDPSSVRVGRFYHFAMARVSRKSGKERVAVDLRSDWGSSGMDVKAARTMLNRFVGIMRDTVQEGETTVTVGDADVTFSTGSRTERLAYPFIKELLRELGFKEFRLRHRPGLLIHQVVGWINWLTLAYTIVREDLFLGVGDKRSNEEDRKEVALQEWLARQRKKLQARKSGQSTQETNIKALTIDQFQNDFMDARTRNLMRYELANRVKYIILTEKGESSERSREKLAQSNFDLAWLDKGQVVILPLIEVVGETQTLNVEGVITQTMTVFDLPKDSFKAQVQNLSDDEEQTNFVLAVGEKINLSGEKDKVRYFKVRKGVRLSETLPLLSGLFMASLRHVIETMKDYLLAHDFTQKDLDDLMAMEGDVLIPPVKTGNLVNQLIEDKKARDLISWAA